MMKKNRKQKKIKPTHLIESSGNKIIRNDLDITLSDQRLMNLLHETYDTGKANEMISKLTTVGVGFLSFAVSMCITLLTSFVNDEVPETWKTINKVLWIICGVIFGVGILLLIIAFCCHVKQGTSTKKRDKAIQKLIQKYILGTKEDVTSPSFHKYISETIDSP